MFIGIIGGIGAGIGSTIRVGDGVGIGRTEEGLEVRVYDLEYEMEFLSY